MHATALISGGKDSVYSAYLAETQGWTLDELLTLAPSDPHSMMFHTPNVDLVALQAEAWGRPHRNVPLKAKGEGPEEAELERALAEAPGDWIVAGAIASSYQFTRLLRIADGLGRRVYAPLWGKAGLRAVEEEVAAGLDIRFVHLAAEGIPEGWLGRGLDHQVLTALASGVGSPRAFHPAGEGGEYETLVVDAPFFERRIDLGPTEVRRSASSSTLFAPHATLVRKADPAGKTG